ncbi:MAG: DUF4336 domain-containing protein [Pseudomonadota bacterium]
MAKPEIVVAEQIWSARYVVRTGPMSIPVRSTIIKLADGKLWICSPPKPTPTLLEALRELGPCGYVVAPNLQHHLHFAEFLANVPSAEGVVAPGLRNKVPALRDHRVLGEGDWANDLTGFFVEGLPVLNETVWIHKSTGTLIVADLLFDFGADNPLFLRLVARLLGVDGRLAMSRTMKLAVKDRAALKRTIDRIMSYRIDRIITAHDQIITSNVEGRLAAAFAWLRP